MKIYTSIKNWYIRTFTILTLEEVFKLQLIHKHNVFGDPINWNNCRSMWMDKKGNIYKCNALYFETQDQFNLWYTTETHIT